MKDLHIAMKRIYHDSDLVLGSCETFSSNENIQIL
jgi:hypothetical protein